MVPGAFFQTIYQKQASGNPSSAGTRLGALSGTCKPLGLVNDLQQKAFLLK